MFWAKFLWIQSIFLPNLFAPQNMNDFLKQKKAERTRKLLAKLNPSKIDYSVPPTVKKSPPCNSNVQATPNNTTQNEIERESGTTFTVNQGYTALTQMLSTVCSFSNSIVNNMLLLLHIATRD